MSSTISSRTSRRVQAPDCLTHAQCFIFSLITLHFKIKPSELNQWRYRSWLHSLGRKATNPVVKSDR